MSEQDHQTCLALLRERTALQKQIREPLARIQEIEREIVALETNALRTTPHPVMRSAVG